MKSSRDIRQVLKRLTSFLIYVGVVPMWYRFGTGVVLSTSEEGEISCGGSVTTLPYEWIYLVPNLDHFDELLQIVSMLLLAIGDKLFSMYASKDSSKIKSKYKNIQRHMKNTKIKSNTKRPRNSVDLKKRSILKVEKINP